MEKAPLLSAVAEPKSVEPLYSFTVLSASALPVIVGVVSFVVVAVVVKDVGGLVDVFIVRFNPKSIFPYSLIADVFKEVFPDASVAFR